MTTPPTIVFDLDGTLADTIHDLIAALNRSLRRHGLEPLDASDVAHLTGRGGLRAMIAHALARTDRPAEFVDRGRLFAETVEDYGRHVEDRSALYPGARAALDDFRADDWRLAVCTNKPAGLARRALGELGIDGYFDAVTGADSFEFRKPDPRHLLRTVDLAGGHRGRAVLVGDTEADIAAAKRASMPVVAVDFGYSDVPVATLGPDAVILSFAVLHSEAAALVG